MPTQTINPRLSRMPVIQRKRASGLSHASVMRNDGYTDFAAVGIKLPISVARAKVRTRPAAFCGEMAKMRFEAAIKIKVREHEEINSISPRSGWWRDSSA